MSKYFAGFFFQFSKILVRQVQKTGNEIVPALFENYHAPKINQVP